MGTSLLVLCLVTTLGGVIGQNGLPLDILQICGPDNLVRPSFCTEILNDSEDFSEKEEEMFLEIARAANEDDTVESRQGVYPPQHPVVHLNDEKRLDLGHVLAGAGGLAAGALVANAIKNRKPTPAPVVVAQPNYGYPNTVVHPNYGYPNTVVHPNPVVVHPNYGYRPDIVHPSYGYRPVYSHVSPYRYPSQYYRTNLEGQGLESRGIISTVGKGVAAVAGVGALAGAYAGYKAGKYKYNDGNNYYVNNYNGYHDPNTYYVVSNNRPSTTLIYKRGRTLPEEDNDDQLIGGDDDNDSVERDNDDGNVPQ